MDKKMINIDDLVRQRLGGVEEEDRTGGWLQMRELLDKKMPTDVAGGIVNWRRTLSYVAALLLLTSVSVGGYQMLSSSRYTSNTHMVATAPTRAIAGNTSSYHQSNNYTNNNTPGNQTSSATNTVASVNNNHTNNHHTSKNTAAGTLSTPTNSIHTKNIADNNMQVAATNSRKHDKNAKAKSYAQGNNINSFAANSTANTAHKSSAHNAKGIGIASVAGKAQHAVNKNQGNLANTKNTGSANLLAGNNSNMPGKTPGNGKVKNTAASVAANTHHSGNKNTGNVVNPKNAIPDQLLVGSGSNVADKTLVNIKAPAKDSIDVLKVEDHYSKAPGAIIGRYQRDTTSQEKMANAAKQGIQPLTPQVAAATAPATTPAVATSATQKTFASHTPNSSASGKSTAIVPAAALVATSTAAIAKKKSNGPSMADKIDEMLTDTKDNMKNMRFNTGLLAGVNGTFFGPNSFGGFQLGAAGELSLNDRWSIMAELKYMHRFNNGTVFNDNYSTYSQGPGTWERDSILHRFNFSTLHTIDLPISVRYTAGNFTVFIGGDLVYNFSINYGESIGEVQGQQNIGPLPGDAVSHMPFINNNDFAARFGAGYLFGLSYHVTPQIQLDMRMTQTVWDNSTTASQKFVSNALYKSPSLQCSIIYSLNDRKGVK